MIEHYNAFISYKHAPLDNKVAAEIQTRLERFRIPKAIRKASGIQKIDRIFRDKEELLITSDLNETIEQALLHSDFLIVICSHATKESIWVQREIEFFLKTHPKNRVLTVVAEGEPVDVVPRILQEQEVTVTLDNGETETVVMPMEPLSCDYRGDFRTARKEELPRLAAAMLGCSYDELKQRQRQYRVRRMAAAFSAVAVLLAALSVYYAWSAGQIKENYLQSLKNQSQYLSAESLSLLDQGDRINAMLLALEALPKDAEDERPVIPEAEYALAKAVNAYISPNTNWYAVECAFSHGGKIDNILTNRDESYLFVLHSRNTFTVWNVLTREKVCEEVMTNNITDAAVSFDDRLLINSCGVIYCYDYRSGQCLWEFAANNFEGEYANTSHLAVAENAPVAACNAGTYLVTLDTSDGQVLQKIPMPTHESTYTESGMDEYTINYLEFSPDGKALFVHLDGNESPPAVADLEAETLRLCPVDFWMIDDAVFTQEGNIVFIGESYVRNGNWWSTPLYYYQDGFSEVVCMDPQGNFLWVHEIHYSEMSVGLGDEVALFNYHDSEGNPISALACVAGEKLVFLDPATGEVLKENAYTGAIVTLSVYDNHLSTVLADGMMGQYILSADLNVAADFFIEGIDLAADNEHTFVSDSTTGNVLLYTYALHDANWTEMEIGEDAALDFYTNNKYSAGDTTVLVSFSGLEEPFVVIDSQNRAARLCEPLSEEFMDDHYMKGLTPDGSGILMKSYSDPNTYMGVLDLATMEYIPDYYTLPAGCNDLFFHNGDLYFISLISSPEVGVCYGLYRQSANGDIDSWIIPTVDPEAYLDSKFLYLTPGEDMALVQDWHYGTDVSYYALDLESGNLSHTEPLPPIARTATWSADGQLFYLTDENFIRAYDRSCKEVFRILCNGMTPNALFASGQDLFVLYGTDRIYRYQANDGTFLNKIEVDAGSSLADDCRWDASLPGTLALFNDDTLNLIDTESWVVRTQVADCLSFDQDAGLIFTAQRDTDERMRYGYYELYSYEDLIAMAKEQLGDTALSAEMRAKYGIT